ncbi:MAG: hypothetical protein RIS94_1815 [Pseudomonadota bacterium]|jgi:heme oxygenase
MSAVAVLRAATRADHARVDAAFGRHDLGTAAGYGAFLMAQARALPAVERALRPGELLAGWKGRSIALLDDLAAMGLDAPGAAGFAPPDSAAARWGAIYVLEGSRLGGAVLHGRVGDGLPTRFLRARHRPGDWRRLLQRLDAMDEGPGWRAEAVDGAVAAFGAFLGGAVLCGAAAGHP